MSLKVKKELFSGTVSYESKYASKKSSLKKVRYKELSYLKMHLMCSTIDNLNINIGTPLTNNKDKQS